VKGAAASVALQSVGKRYRRRGPWVLRHLDLDVSPGTVVELRGANGAGKSTLLRLLVGATQPTRGSRTTAPGLRAGYAPDQQAPAPPFTAAGYLAHHARLRRLDDRAAEEQSTVLASRLGFAHLLPQRLAELSAGTQRKVLLVQAFLGQPDLVVLDEPFSGLDIDARQALGTLLLERSASGTAIVFSDHVTRWSAEWLATSGSSAMARQMTDPGRTSTRRAGAVPGGLSHGDDRGNDSGGSLRATAS